MYRQSPSRNQRSKGIRIKHVLQICLLLAVCFWLIYQVKHSHDKKKEFDESDAKGLLEKGSSDDNFIRLGRKDLKPRLGGITSKDEKHDEPAEEEDETIVEEVQEHKQEEEDEEEDNRVEEKEDENKGSGDDETDEHEQEKSDAEVDGGEENVVDDEKEREVDDGNETQETDSEDGHGQIDKENSVEEHDRDGDDRSTHEAREEHYKADDASSAVTHDDQTTSTENENEHPENILEEQNKENNIEESNKNEDRRDLAVEGEHTENILEEQSKENNIEGNNKSEDSRDLAVEGGEIAQDDHQSNVTATETKVDMVDNSENSSPPNNTVTERSNGHLPSNTSSEVITQNHDLPPQNVTESEPILEESGLHTVASEWANNSTVNVDSDHFSSNSTDSAEWKDAESHPEEIYISSSNNTESSASEKITGVEGSLETRNVTESTSENNEEIEAEKISDGTDEILESTTTENPEEVRDETIDISDTSNSLEEKDVRTDLDTLPEIQTEGSHSEDVAAE